MRSAKARHLPGMALPTLQFPLHRLPQQVRTILPVLKSGIDPLNGPGREACRHLLVVNAFSAHAHKIADIR